MRRLAQQNRRNRLLFKATILSSVALLGYYLAGVILPPKPVTLTATQKAEPKIDPETHYVKYEQKVKPLMEHYCYDCHGDGSEKGDLDMERFTSFASMTQDRETWEKIRGHLKLKLMPPVDEEQPDSDEVSVITDWIDSTIFYTDPKNPDPGKVVIRRLNRNEYENTIHDLFGVKINATSLLPLDDTGYGFDTISAVHTVSPAHIEKYLSAAEVALDKATVIGKMPWNEQVFQANQLRYQPTKIKNGYFFTNGKGQLPKRVTEELKPGIYEIEIEASSTPGGDEEAILEVGSDEKNRVQFKVPPGQAHTVSKLKLSLTKNTKLTFAFINDYYDKDHPNKARRDRNLTLHQVTIRGPIDQARPPKPSSHQDIFHPRNASQSSEEYAIAVWKKFATKAFRRPVSREEISPYLKFLDQNDTGKEDLEHQILLGLQAMLVSPHFLYLQSTAVSDQQDSALITELALASRLSYFIWSSAPDQQLLEKASNKLLRKDLKSEIDRMLDDPKAKRMVKNFAGQWLQLRDLDVHSPDSKLFPNWNASLRNDGINETVHFIHHLIQNDLSALDCLDSNYSFLNQNLAQFYGISNVKGKHFRKVTLTPDLQRQRGGLLGQVSILTLTSYPDRTSPVLRGKWVLENILGTPPPPPPADIPELQPDEKQREHISLRKQLEAHRKKAECAACHNLLDPLGFALQNYNGIGKWRTRTKGALIDTTGQLISGEVIQDGAQLRNVLKYNKADDFMRCLTEKLLTYGIGRGLEYYDKPAIDQILTESMTNDHSFRDLIHSVCRSVPFQMTRTKHFQTK